MSNMESVAEAYANRLSVEVDKIGINEEETRLVRITAKKAFYEGAKAMLGLTIGTMANMYKAQFKEEWEDGQRND